jgi:hypothetical protein
MFTVMKQGILSRMKLPVNKPRLLNYGAPVLISFFICCATPALAQTELPTQSPVRPLGLETVGPVFQAGSDGAAADFQADALPGLQAFINQQLGESQTLADVGRLALDPSTLQLQSMSDVRVYFVSEVAGYHNTLGFNAEGQGVSDGNPLLIFPDASSYLPTYLDGDTALGIRNSNAPLLPGDFVDLGSYDAGTQLDFFLIANGANGGTNTYTADESLNPDGIQHMVAFALEGSPYLLVGFEDLYGGGDLDFNDILYAVDIGESNVAAAIALATPESTTGLVLGALMAGLLPFCRWRAPA